MIVINSSDEMISFVQDKLYEQLKEIDRICVENNIKYSLAGGTFLGAIRHNGFIPWDDDADVLMERSEFEKFQNIMMNSKSSSKYKLIRGSWSYRISEDINVQYKEQIIELITTDVFVYDKVPLSNLLYTLQIIILKTLQGMLKKREYMSWKNKSILQNIAQSATFALGLLFSREIKIKCFDYISQIFNNNTIYKEFFAGNDDYKDMDKAIPRTLFETITTHKFRDSSFMILGNYDYYLTKWYGDYMKLPPKELQKPTRRIDIN